MLQWYYFALASSVLLGIETLIEKGTLRKEYASAYNASFTMLTAIVVLFFIPFAKFNVSMYDIIAFYIIGAILALIFLLNARIYRHGNISVASPLLSTLPIFFVVVLGFTLLGEGLTYTQYLFMALLIVFSSLLLRNKTKDPDKKYFEKTKYTYLIALSGFLTAVAAILTRYFLIAGIDVFAFLVITQLSMALNMAVYMTIKYGGIKEVMSNLIHHKVPLISIALLTVVDRAFYYTATAIAFISLVAPVRYSINVIITTLIGGLIFKETNILRKILLAVLMLISVYFIIVPFTI